MEPFGVCIGCDTTINMNVVNKRRFKGNTDVTNEQINNAVNTFTNDFVTNLDVQTMVNSLFNTAASNNIVLQNISCNNINISNISQTNTITSDVKSSIKSNIINNVSNNVSNTITSKIIQSSPPTSYIQNIIDANQKTLNDFYKATEIDYNKLGQMASNAASNACSSGIGNSSTFNLNLTQDTDISNTIGITNKMINNVTNTFTNATLVDTVIKSIQNIINNISADNIIKLQSVKCGSLRINDISQINTINNKFASSIDQSVLNTISSNITQNIDTIYTTSYDDVVKDFKSQAMNVTTPDKSKELIDAFNAKIDNLAAVELASLYTMCGSDPVLKCKIQQQYNKLNPKNKIDDSCLANAIITNTITTNSAITTNPAITTPPLTTQKPISLGLSVNTDASTTASQQSSTSFITDNYKIIIPVGVGIIILIIVIFLIKRYKSNPTLTTTPTGS